MSDEGERIALEDGAGRIGEAMRGAAAGLTEAERATRALSATVGTGFRRALEEAVFGAGRLSDALKGLAGGMARDALRAAVDPVRDAVGRGVGGLVSQAVGALAGVAVGAGGVRAFAKGGVVDGPTVFPLGGGAGVMGEAGPEAILPLARGADGRLGVRGGAGVHVTLNVTTPDAAGFRRSGPQIAAELARAVERGRRNL